MPSNNNNANGDATPKVKPDYEAAARAALDHFTGRHAQKNEGAKAARHVFAEARRRGVSEAEISAAAELALRADYDPAKVEQLIAAGQADA